MKESYEARLAELKDLTDECDFVLIGGGSGLSAAAGLAYSGARFEENFGDYIITYGMRDMYSAGFYPFSTQEKKWAYWSRHVKVNRFDPPALPLYSTLLTLVREKDYFVLTTNVDAQFYKAGFSIDRIFAVQGDYGKFQCARGCHNALYDNRSAILNMAASQSDCTVPSELVPRCPICGGNMEINIRVNPYFVEDEAWHEADLRFREYMERSEDARRLLLLELGVGFNTPSIIRFPFERTVYQRDNATLVRINAECPEALPENTDKTLSFGETIEKVLGDLIELKQKGS